MSTFNKNYTNEAMIPRNMILPAISQPSYKERYTKREWSFNNDIRRKIVEDQQKIADKILKECERIRDQTEERTRINKETTERRIQERVEDVQFITNELNLKRDEVCEELEALGVYKTRLINCLNSLRENSLEQCARCLEIRENRIGIDLIIDDVEVALQKEMFTILTWQDRLQKILEETQEAMRRLRAIRYIIDADLEFKEYAIEIENETANLRSTNLSLTKNKMNFNLNPAKISKLEWEIYTAKNLKNATKELHQIRPIRMMIDLFLREVSEDLRAAFVNANNAFKNRIAEVRKVKDKLEDMLSETVIKIEAMTENINSLQKALDDKIPFMALANKRIESRSQRKGVELVKDSVSHSLYKESVMIKASFEQLEAALREAHISLRHLNQAQVNLQDDIKVKTNSLAIDECECLTIRETMTRFEF